MLPICLPLDDRGEIMFRIAVREQKPLISGEEKELVTTSTVSLLNLELEVCFLRNTNSAKRRKQRPFGKENRTKHNIPTKIYSELFSEEEGCEIIVRTFIEKWHRGSEA